MSWSYNSALDKKMDQVRFLLQDTDTNRQLVQDEEIVWLLGQEANVYMAAAACADVQSSKIRGLTTKKVGELTHTYSAEQWGAVAARLRQRGSTYQVLSAGGVLTADRDSLWEDSTLLRPAFFDEMHQDAGQLPPARGADLTDEELP